MSLDYPEIASSWLRRFDALLVSFDAARTAACFHEDGFLRNILVFTWSNHTLSGRAKIAAYLHQNLTSAAVRSIKLDDRPHLTPEFTDATSSIASGFTFETVLGPGQGYFTLNPTPSGEWYATSVFMTLSDIRGHEETGPEDGVYGGHTLAWSDIARERRLKIEQNPQVLISTLQRYYRFDVS